MLTGLLEGRLRFHSPWWKGVGEGLSLRPEPTTDAVTWLWYWLIKRGIYSCRTCWEVDVCVCVCDLDITGQTLSQSYLKESLIKSSESEIKWLVSDHGYFDNLFIVSMIFQAKIVQNIKHDHHGQVPDEMSSCFSLFDIIVNWISFGSGLVLGSFPWSLWSCDFSYEPEISKKNVTRMYKHLSKTYSY